MLKSVCHKWQSHNISSYFILSAIHWLHTVEILTVYFLLAFKLLFSVNSVVSHYSKFLPLTTAVTALVYKWWTVLVAHHETQPSPYAAEPLFTDIKIEHSIHPTTPVKRKQAGRFGMSVFAHLFLHLQRDLPPLNICLIPPADLILSVGSWSRETEPTQTQALWRGVWRQHLLWRGPGASASRGRLLISQYQQGKKMV